jgi:DNA invertase Pin-like site-specific DNA recombinase
MNVRCAIYTRKSSEEGLEQSFNSLHAQREACEAYVRSQAGEGWHARRDRYDDGGHSGGSMNRPALQKLMADIAGRKVDVVVVYKVDRLTRSLADFARIIDALDRAGVSFVSVTQAFNTSSSMGRLTLNVLLSFAQFERDITGERIRDKIAASKARGMWMGGAAPLGYDPPTDPTTRTLVLNAEEARTVRGIFHRYLELGSLSALRDALRDAGIRSKRWLTQAGRRMGGCILTSGALRHLLRNRTYVGEIPHKGATFPARHLPIVDRATFDAVQALLEHKSVLRRTRVPKAHAALLFGRLFDGDGQPMEPIAHQRRNGATYRYYASGPIAGARDDEAIRRVRADVADTFVKERLGRLLGLSTDSLDAAALRSVLLRAEVLSSTVQLVLSKQVLDASHRTSLNVLRARLLPGEGLRVEPMDARRVRISFPTRLQVRGGRRWAMAPDGGPMEALASPDPILIQRLRAAHDILRSCGASPDQPATRIRAARSPRSSHHSRLLRLAFLAPDIQAAILEGRCHADALRTSQADIPLSWAKQRQLFGMSEQPEILH